MVTKQQTKFALLGAITSILPFAGIASAATSGVGGVVVDSSNSHAYELVLDPAASWSQAESTAVGAGGYLVTPTSQSEDAFLDQILSTNNAPTGSYWLGLTREPGQLVGGGTGTATSTGSGTKTASQFYFVTDEPVTYTNWGPNLPDNFAGTEDSGSVKWTSLTGADHSDASQSGKWNDLPNAGYTAGNGQFSGDLIRAGYVVEWDSVAAAGAGISASAPVAAVPLPNAAFLFMTGATIATFAVRRSRMHRA